MILAWLIGCAAPPAPALRLPDQLSAVVSLERGGYASVVVDLDRADQAPRVRIAPGLTLVGQGWARALSMERRTANAPVQLRLLDALHEGAPLIEASLHGEAELIAADADKVWLRDELGARTLVAGGAPGELAASGPVAPAGELHRAGPGNGFQARLRDGHLEVQRPRGDPAAWRPVLQGVEAILGAWFLHSPSLPEDELALIDTTFKQVGLLTIEQGQATIDGVLTEWLTVPALPVDAAAQVQSGLDAWDGPRDGAFGVAARADGRRLLLAFRVRDDQPAVGDRLEIALGDQLIRVPLVGGVERPSGRGWTAVRTPLGPRETGVELALELSREGARPRAVAWLVDADPGQPETRLGTAPDAYTAELAALTAPDEPEAARP